MFELSTLLAGEYSKSHTSNIFRTNSMLADDNSADLRGDKMKSLIVWNNNETLWKRSKIYGVFLEASFNDIM